MDDRHLTLLPGEMQKAVQDIEAVTETPIAILPMKQAPADILSGFFKAGLERITVDGRTTFTVYFDDDANTHLLWHELGHVALRVLYRAPEFACSTDTTATAARISAISNDLDHAAIVGREIALFGREAEEHWASDFEEQLGGIRSLLRANSSHLRAIARERALRLALVARTVLPQWSEHPRLDDALGALDAGAVVADLLSALPNAWSLEQPAAPFIFEALGIDRKHIVAQRLLPGRAGWETWAFR